VGMSGTEDWPQKAQKTQKYQQVIARRLCRRLSAVALAKADGDPVFGPGRAGQAWQSAAERRGPRSRAVKAVLAGWLVKNQDLRLASNQHGIPHGTGVGCREKLTLATQLDHFFANQDAELAVGALLSGAMADAAPREEIGAMADISAVFLAPTDKLEIAVFGFQQKPYGAYR